MGLPGEIGSIGSRIRERRRAIGMSQEELARAVGVSQPSIAQYEAGNRAVSAHDLPRLSAALGVTVGHLYGEDGITFLGPKEFRLPPWKPGTGRSAMPPEGWGLPGAPDRRTDGGGRRGAAAGPVPRAGPGRAGEGAGDRRAAGRGRDAPRRAAPGRDGG